MSDFAWIAFIIIVYMVVIKPMMGGILQKPVEPSNQKAGMKGTVQNEKSNFNRKEEDYVDYEEVK